MPDRPPMFATEGLSFSYPLATTPALVLPALTIGASERVLIAGATGSGKSTLLNLLLGFLVRDVGGDLDGDGMLWGAPLREAKPAWIGHHLGVVFQNPADQGVAGQCGEEVALGLRVLGLDEADVQRRTREALTEVGLADRAHDPPALLSGGQQQRLAIACAIARQPAMLVLDEPFSQLDPRGAWELAGLLDTLTRRHGMGLVIAEHRLELALRVVDRVIALEDGAVVGDWPAEQLASQLPPELSVATVEAVSGNELLASLDGIHVRYPGSSTDALLITQRLPAGVPIALVGANGSGKSTLLHLLAGLLKPSTGRLSWPNTPAPRVSLVPQNADLRLLGRTIGDDLRLTRASAADIARVAADCGLPPLDQPPLGSSKGQRLQIALASALLEQPDVLLLDEPTTGQDRAHVAAILDLLKASPAQVIFATHDLNAARALAGYAVLLMQGEVFACGLAHEVLNDRALLRRAGLLPEAGDG